MHLPRVLPGTEQEEVGERRRMPQIEHDDVDGFLVERRLDRFRDLAGQLPAPWGGGGFRRRDGALSFSLGHAIDLPARRFSEGGPVCTTGVDGYELRRAGARAR